MKSLERVVLAATVAVGAAALHPDRAAAQLEVGVHLSWHWGDGGWYREPARPRGEVYYAPAPRTRHRAPTRAVRIPPGHLPPPGTCRLWYVGRPPGHQPPPASCARLFRSYRQPGVIILQGAPLHRGGDEWYGYDPRWDRDVRYRYDDRERAYYRYDDRWDDDDRWERDLGPRFKSPPGGPPGRGNRGRGAPGRGRGGGRGG